MLLTKVVHLDLYDRDSWSRRKKKKCDLTVQISRTSFDSSGKKKTTLTSNVHEDPTYIY